MPFILTIVYLLQGFIDANAAPPLDLLSQRTTIDAQQCVSLNARSKWDIVWSCLITIFACSWASVHPNILAPDEGLWKKTLQRFKLVFWSIISPELVIYWASVQWYGAYCLGKKYSEYGWTTTHGHFIQMGGFILYDGDKEAGVLVPGKFWDLFQEEKVAMPKVTEREIKDRSKSDKLAKAAVVIQTTWFIAQCIARRVRGLIITKLELVTLAFAALNAIMYAFWWDKPLDVTTTIRVHLSAAIRSHKPGTESEEPPKRTAAAPNNERRRAQCQRAGVMSEGAETPGTWSATAPDNANLPTPTPARTTLPCLTLTRTLNTSERTTGSGGPPRLLLPRSPLPPLASSLPFVSLYEGCSVSPPDTTVPRYLCACPSCKVHALPDVVSNVFVHFKLLASLHLFGVIHCAGWNFAFPSVIELNIWRFSSGIITAAAAIGVMNVLFSFLKRYYTTNSLVSRFRDVLRWLTLPMVPLYILARLTLLVEALISLRDLPQLALAGVKWTSFIPHV
ncbi:hypothetical protein GALMADRAFT_70554 [Galerina marginata CBS 339.88]|uniref:Wax synthase domain-containing protein n=1 Tax=Galerina marginata (strain CBS 339.88) TaxID=685588 RepID=A0A067SX75_GALM3|nr:hypothetical protein GALMADRAFT_70554 [Galerina marginata CBS 339.88]